METSNLAAMRPLSSQMRRRHIGRLSEAHVPYEGDILPSFGCARHIKIKATTNTETIFCNFKGPGSFKIIKNMRVRAGGLYRWVE
jgi:hypothetical protein